MNISELIAALTEIQREHGDLAAEDTRWDGERCDARQPQVAYRRILVGRQSKPRFYESYEPQELRGEKVCRL
jgi:hypothetical protein